MKSPSHFLNVFILVILSYSTSSFAISESIEVQHKSHQKLSLNHNKKWQTDQVLRREMDGLHSMYKKDLSSIQKHKLTSPEYLKLAKETEIRITHIVEQCKLDAETDQMLHIILEEIITGVEMMKRKSETTQNAGSMKIRLALNKYGKYFDHPGWYSLR